MKRSMSISVFVLLSLTLYGQDSAVFMGLRLDKSPEETTSIEATQKVSEKKSLSGRNK